MPDAQQLVLAAWAVIAATLFGLGRLWRGAFAIWNGSDAPAAVEALHGFWPVFWTGWAVLLSLLQVWHLFLPVDDRARIAVGAVATLGLTIALVQAARRGLPRPSWRAAAAIAAVAPVAYWLSHLSMAGPRFGDTGMYLVPTVHWYSSHAVVPGLANLFVPLGHNLSYFLYAALLDGGPFARHFYHIVNSALVMALLARGVTACLRLLGRRPRDVPADLFHALALVPTVDLAVGLFLTSPSPDTAVYLFGLVLAGELVAFLAAAEPSRAAVVRLAFLGAAGMTLKLSIAGLSLATGALALLWWWRRSRASVGQALRLGAVATLVALFPLGTWMLRNAITSGYPLYPAAYAALPVDWIARVDATAWIQKPMAMAPLSTIFTSPDWWKLRLVSLGWTEQDVLRPLALVAVGVVAFAILRPLDRWRGRASLLPVVVLLTPLAAFWFCFVNTPMPRYQGATLWILGIELVVLALATSVAEGGRVLRGAVVASILAGASLPIVASEDPWPAHREFEPTSPPRIHQETLASGLTVGVPENQVCWYAELPCTPEPHPGLRLREPGNLGAGFAIDVLPEAPAN